MIEKISLNIANFIRNHNDKAASVEVLKFSTIIVLNTILVTVAIFGVALITGHAGVALILLSSYVVLRFFSGGVHFPSSMLCNVFSIVFFSILIHLPVERWGAGFALNIAALVLVIFFAPTKDVTHLSRLGPKYALHFKAISVALVLLNFWLQSPIVALAFLTQAVAVTPIAYRAVALLERR